MSVLIKDMKMPKECRECPFIGYYWKSGETLCSANSKIIAYNFKPIEFDGRHHDCPLVEIKTPHRRLTIQPEIIHCKDCEYGVQDEYGRWYCHSIGCQIGDEDGSGFCADAERRSE